MGRNILLVDDEETIHKIVKMYLEEHYYYVFSATSGSQARKMLDTYPYDAVILDIVLPDIDGLSLLQYIRSQTQLKKLPVIMVTSKDSEMDRVIGLEMGADDYVCKPFSQRELLARLKSVFRRTDEIIKFQQNIMAFKNIEIDTTERIIYINKKSLKLSKREFDLLVLLARYPKKVFTREDLLNSLWGIDSEIDGRTVDVHIRYLRKKLATLSDHNFIETLRGVGYRFIED